MSRTDPQMKVRLPQELKDTIQGTAEANGRSMNAEIVYRLSKFMDLLADIDERDAVIHDLAMKLERADNTIAQLEQDIKAAKNDLETADSLIGDLKESAHNDYFISPGQLQMINLLTAYIVSNGPLNDEVKEVLGRQPWDWDKIREIIDKIVVIK